MDLKGTNLKHTTDWTYTSRIKQNGLERHQFEVHKQIGGLLSRACWRAVIRFSTLAQVTSTGVSAASQNRSVVRVSELACLVWTCVSGCLLGALLGILGF